MEYLFFIILGIAAGIVINLASDFERPYYENKLLWLSGYMYKKVRYIAVVAITVFIFAETYHYSQDNYQIIRFCLFFIILMICSIKDIKEKEIPNKVIITGILLGLAVCTMSFDTEIVLDSVITCVITGFILYLVSMVTKGGIGMGDMKLMAVCGLFLGFSQTTAVLLISLLLTGVIGIIYILLKKASLKSAIPFAPFITAGFVINLLTG
jgi:leader peptidase (prepilin peptidase)/N-methyltransferase